MTGWVVKLFAFLRLASFKNSLKRSFISDLILSFHNYYIVNKSASMYKCFTEIYLQYSGFNIMVSQYVIMHNTVNKSGNVQNLKSFHILPFSTLCFVRKQNKMSEMKF